MTEIKSKCFRLLAAVLMATQFACSSGEKSKDDAYAILDTLNYGKPDYDSMRAFFNADTLVISRLNKAIEAGDTNAMKMKKMLATEYESRAESGVFESDINACIFAFYTSKNILEKFEEMDRSLQKTRIEKLKEIEGILPEARNDPENVRAQTDSIIQAIEEIKKGLKQE